MPLDTTADIKAEIIELKADIAETRKRQAHTAGGAAQGQHTVRGDLRAMYDRLEKLERRYAIAEAQEQGATVPSLVQFEVIS